MSFVSQIVKREIFFPENPSGNQLSELLYYYR